MFTLFIIRNITEVLFDCKIHFQIFYFCWFFGGRTPFKETLLPSNTARVSYNGSSHFQHCLVIPSTPSTPPLPLVTHYYNSPQRQSECNNDPFVFHSDDIHCTFTVLNCKQVLPNTFIQCVKSSCWILWAIVYEVEVKIE